MNIIPWGTHIVWGLIITFFKAMMAILNNYFFQLIILSALATRSHKQIINNKEAARRGEN